MGALTKVPPAGRRKILNLGVSGGGLPLPKTRFRALFSCIIMDFWVPDFFSSARKSQWDRWWDCGGICDLRNRSVFLIGISSIPSPAHPTQIPRAPRGLRPRGQRRVLHQIPPQIPIQTPDPPRSARGMVVLPRLQLYYYIVQYTGQVRDPSHPRRPRRSRPSQNSGPLRVFFSSERRATGVAFEGSPVWGNPLPFCVERFPDMELADFFRIWGVRSMAGIFLVEFPKVGLQAENNSPENP